MRQSQCPDAHTVSFAIEHFRLFIVLTVVEKIRRHKDWFPYDRRQSRIAESSAIVCDHMETHFCDPDRRRSQNIERSQKIKHGSIMPEDRTWIVCDPAIIWKPKFCDLRSKCIP